MTSRNGDDERLRALFDEVKAEDRGAHSTYSGVFARSMRPGARVITSPVLKLAAAAAIVVAAGVMYHTAIVQKPRLTVPTEVVSLVAWRPETDALLASPAQLLRAQTQVRESMIDLDTLTTGVVP